MGRVAGGRGAARGQERVKRAVRRGGGATARAGPGSRAVPTLGASGGAHGRTTRSARRLPRRPRPCRRGPWLLPSPTAPGAQGSGPARPRRAGHPAPPRPRESSPSGRAPWERVGAPALASRNKMLPGRRHRLQGPPACLLLLLALPTVAPSCPMLCTCYTSPPTVSCQANNFSSVPLSLPPGTQRLFLQNNLIRTLRPGTFGPHLLTLWLFSNNLSTIYPGTFRHLQALEELDLGDNRHLRSLEPDTFRGLERLQSLHLYRCQLSSLPSTIFRGLVSLQYLYLQDNSLLHLQDDLFADLANLSHLFLHGNRLRLLTEHVFRGLGGLDRLLLHGNRLQGVHRAAFRGLGRLTILYLFNNSLASLPGEALADLPALEFLRLNANPWACDCRARPLWAWFQRARVSSSDVTCATPPERRGRDLRSLREADFRACPAGPRPGGNGAGTGSGGRARGNSSSNHLYGVAEPGAPPAPPATLARDLPAEDADARGRHAGNANEDAPTEDDYWGGYGGGRTCPGPSCRAPPGSRGPARTPVLLHAPLLCLLALAPRHF
ncbi:reticulon-4 receptor-like 2 isoform X2 [Cavia porcellus]|uniref:reticulon-4 receptor-like 2 isoform X2 n=1 Tax=Cavia porcellus TaxID=10141 RepID=UPI002FE28B97